MMTDEEAVKVLTKARRIYTQRAGRMGSWERTRLKMCRSRAEAIGVALERMRQPAELQEKSR
jgi:hypothetical protein